MLFAALRPVKALVFDFDYTLFDSSDGVVECMQSAIRSIGVPPPSEALILPHAGHATAWLAAT